MTVQWDPLRYAAYADERSRPFLDLVAQVEAHDRSTSSTSAAGRAL
jgi:trans-aconitate methyltransferase